MSTASLMPDHSALEVPMDMWTEPFWRAGEEGRLTFPRCTHCGAFRWPGGPFCPDCRHQAVEWVEAGQARLYSFTAIPVPGADKAAAPGWRMPAVAVFDGVPGVRLVSALVGADPGKTAIDDPLTIEWIAAANTKVPVFRRVGG